MPSKLYSNLSQFANGYLYTNRNTPFDGSPNISSSTNYSSSWFKSAEIYDTGGLAGTFNMESYFDTVGSYPEFVICREVDDSVNNININLPDISISGRITIAKTKIPGGANNDVVTVSPPAGKTIAGESSVVIANDSPKTFFFSSNYPNTIFYA
jgi:hypothetical protein